MSLQKIITTQPLVLVDFFAVWCEPCKWVEPVLDDVLKSFPGKIALHKVDIDAEPSLARAYHVLSVPTLVLFKDSKEVWRMRGFDTAPSLTKILAGFL